MASAPAVVVVSGHMVDRPGRTSPRFPPGEVERVRKEARNALEDWKVGAGTTIVSGGARGADIIVAEEGLKRGARVRLRLGLPPDQFERRSVALPGTDWSVRFRRLLSAADVAVLPDCAGEDMLVRTNAWLLDEAHALGGPQPHVLVVWDGRQGDGPGGTRDFVRRAGYEGPGSHVRVIDPTPRDYERRQWTPGPKKLLALDGGGVRGALSLEILRKLEDLLRDRYGRGMVLSDYFDYIGGTSTGAIIAAALALGKPVNDVAERYALLGKRVFTKRLLPMRVRSLYKDGPLTRELANFFASGRTLGDPKLRSLLLIVLHNVETDSAWPLSNCTQAKYNRADRCLLSSPDRNLDLPLTAVIRGSTAAPVYFEPERLHLGKSRITFQDGGVTPFNNPALLMFVMATLPEYGLRWPVGERALLLVSVGTGTAAAVHPGLADRKVRVMFQAKNLPSVFMNGASIGQDLLCRTFGHCRAGGEIDREVGTRQSAAGENLFTYLRYNADLSDAALIGRGVRKERDRKRLRRLDSVDALPELRKLGQEIGGTINLDTEFAGFMEG